MPNQGQFVRQTIAISVAFALIVILLPGFAKALNKKTVDPRSVLGDTRMPSSKDISQNFPY
jgi:hypothetical protein